MTSELSGKTCLIFGASSGIGAAVARRFGTLGVRQVIHYHENRAGAEETASAIREAGGVVDIAQGDLADAAVASRLVDEAAKTLGSLDIVINNAGTMYGRTTIVEASDAQYRDVIDLNIGGVFHAARRAAAIMRTAGRGTIINTTSIAARTGGGNGAVMYASAKGFVSTFTHGLAKELVKDNIRVNAVSPGVITTPFHERYSTPAMLEAMRATVPMNRLGSADECAGAFLFLASDELSSYVTGQVLEVNGGQYMP